MTKAEQTQFLVDFKNYNKYSERLGAMVGKKIVEGNSDQQISTAIDQLNKKEKTKSYFKRLGKTFGSQNMADMLELTKKAMMQLRTQLRENQLAKK